MAEQEPTPATPIGDEGSLALLRDPVFGIFFAGRFLSTGGVWIHNIVAAMLAYEVTGSTLVVGMVSVAQFGPQLVLSPLSGSVADRLDRRTLLVVGRLLIASGSAAMAGITAAWGVEGMPGAWPLILASVVVGVGFVIAAPAQNAIIPALVVPGRLARAIALNAFPPTLSRATGPALGAYVALSLGFTSAFALAAAMNCVFAVIGARLPMVQEFEHPPGADKRVRAAVRYVWQDKVTGLLLLGVLAVGIGSDPVLTLTPALSDRFGDSTEYVGMFASVFGIGAGLALLAVPRLQRKVGSPTVVSAGLALLATSTALTALAPNPLVVASTFTFAGAGMGAAFAASNTQLLERVPDELRGRIMGVWAVAYLGSRPVAAMLTGSLADSTGPAAALIGVGVLVAVVAWWCRPSQLAVHESAATSRGAAA